MEVKRLFATSMEAYPVSYTHLVDMASLWVGQLTDEWSRVDAVAAVVVGNRMFDCLLCQDRTVDPVSYTHLQLGQLTFVTATDGNHGRGVAWTANQLGQRSVVYMPKGSAQERLENIRKENSDASITDLRYDDTVRLAKQRAEQPDCCLLYTSRCV